MGYNLIQRIREGSFSWKEDLDQTKEDLSWIGYIAGEAVTGLAGVAIGSIVVANLYIGIDAFAEINSGLIDGEYIPIERARDHVYDLWLEERVEGNLLLSAIYTLTVPGRELGFGMGKFFRGATTHDQWGIDRWPDGTLKR